ncbi:hypothetical protein C942_04099 [Photobacterium marinum]|uniref:Uncharacterized protein n=1 Tax=Photobacterium marinum TaxID=1056511 RepID=L8J6L2_9GAMM|nr:hypothetical protein [Photobacterium marinum]ELR63112.1 hypothetical protein C942_04099 [Photobacterium marinum]
MVEIEKNCEDVKRSNDECGYAVAKKRVKLVGVFQILASIVIIGALFLGTFEGILQFTLACAFVLLNFIAGVTAIKGKVHLYWISIVNQLLQVVSFSVNGLEVNYSGIGGACLKVFWGDVSGFVFNAYVSPGFSIENYPESFTSGYIAIDVLALIFIAALLTARKKNIS